MVAEVVFVIFNSCGLFLETALLMLPECDVFEGTLFLSLRLYSSWEYASSLSDGVIAFVLLRLDRFPLSEGFLLDLRSDDRLSKLGVSST